MSLLLLLPPPLFAMVAGVISFSSPCCIPLLPGYVSYISALRPSALGTREARATTLRASVAFVAGFTMVFTALGVASAFFGSFVLGVLPTIVRIMGLGIIVLGLSMTGLLRLPFLQRERRFDMSRLPRGPGGAFGVGVAFAAGWTPCISRDRPHRGDNPSGRLESGAAGPVLTRSRAALRRPRPGPRSRQRVEGMAPSPSVVDR